MKPFLVYEYLMRASDESHIVCDLVSEHQAETIKRDTFLADRVKTENTELYEIVSKINAAMSRTRGQKTHTPEKIKFRCYDLQTSQQYSRQRCIVYKGR